MNSSLCSREGAAAAEWPEDWLEDSTPSGAWIPIRRLAS